MIAYFALLAFVPLLFLALSLSTALAGQPGETNYLIEELRRTFPATSVDRIIDVVEGIQEQATSLGIVGAIGVSWASLGFQRVRVGVQHRLRAAEPSSSVRRRSCSSSRPPRSSFSSSRSSSARSASISCAAGVAGDILSYVYALIVSTSLLFGSLELPAAAHEHRSHLGGDASAPCSPPSCCRRVSRLPIFLRAGRTTCSTRRALGGFVILLIWLYVMANVLVLGPRSTGGSAAGAPARGRPQDARDSAERSALRARS